MSGVPPSNLGYRYHTYGAGQCPAGYAEGYEGGGTWYCSWVGFPDAPVLSDAERAILEQKADVEAKALYLASNTAVWSNETAYKAEVAETTSEIRALNAEIASFLATAPGQQGVTEGALLKKPQQATTAGEKNNNTGIIIIAAAVVVAAGAILLRGRK